MAQAIQEVDRGGFDIMLPTEMKIRTEAYSHNQMGYDVTFSASRPSRDGGTWGELEAPRADGGMDVPGGHLLTHAVNRGYTT